jgi:hypothetical protein
MPTPSVINQFRYSDAINRRTWDNRYNFDNFSVNPVTSAVGGGAATGVAGDTNVLFTQFGQYEWNVIGTQTILAPKLDAFGLNLVQDAAVAGDGLELTAGRTALSPAAFTVNQDAAFFTEVVFKTQDASGTNPMILGFLKVQAFDATITNYTDYACIGIQGTSNPNLVKIQTNLNSAGAVTTDTTQTVADAAVTQLKVLVSSTGVVSYQLNYATPTVVPATTFQFDSGDIVIPFIRFVEAADLTTQCAINYFEWGFQS